MTAHNILYTYVAPLAARAGFAARVDLLLLGFGTASLIGIAVTGLQVGAVQELLHDPQRPWRALAVLDFRPGAVQHVVAQAVDTRLQNERAAGPI